jgi:hypothetical protein
VWECPIHDYNKIQQMDHTHWKWRVIQVTTTTHISSEMIWSKNSSMQQDFRIMRMMKWFFFGWKAYGTAWLLFLNKCKKHIHMRIGLCHSHLFQCHSNQSSQCTFIRRSTCPTIDAFVGGLGRMTWNFFLTPSVLQPKHSLVGWDMEICTWES